MLSANGTFTATDLKNEPFDDYGRPGPHHSGSGTWYVHDRSVSLDFDVLSGFTGGVDAQNALTVVGSGKHAELDFQIGDPDDPTHYVFTRAG